MAEGGPKRGSEVAATLDERTAEEPTLLTSASASSSISSAAELERRTKHVSDYYHCTEAQAKEKSEHIDTNEPDKGSPTTTLKGTHGLLAKNISIQKIEGTHDDRGDDKELTVFGESGKRIVSREELRSESRSVWKDIGDISFPKDASNTPSADLISARGQKSGELKEDLSPESHVEAHNLVSDSDGLKSKEFFLVDRDNDTNASSSHTLKTTMAPSKFDVKGTSELYLSESSVEDPFRGSDNFRRLGKNIRDAALSKGNDSVNISEISMNPIKTFASCDIENAGVQVEKIESVRANPAIGYRPLDSVLAPSLPSQVNKAASDAVNSITGLVELHVSTGFNVNNKSTMNVNSCAHSSEAVVPPGQHHDGRFGVSTFVDFSAASKMVGGSVSAIKSHTMNEVLRDSDGTSVVNNSKGETDKKSSSENQRCNSVGYETESSAEALSDVKVENANVDKSLGRISAEGVIEVDNSELVSTHNAVSLHSSLAQKCDDDKHAPKSPCSITTSQLTDETSDDRTPSVEAGPTMISDEDDVSGEHRKMRCRLQKELRKLGVDPDAAVVPDNKTFGVGGKSGSVVGGGAAVGSGDAESPAVTGGRPSRNAARLAARKISNVVAKSNMSVETLVAMAASGAASDSEDCSNEGASAAGKNLTSIAVLAAASAIPNTQKRQLPLQQEDYSSKRSKLVYCSTQNAVIVNDLVMECSEQALTPCQIDAFRAAVHNYNAVTVQIQHLTKCKFQVTYDSRPLTVVEYDSIMSRAGVGSLLDKDARISNATPVKDSHCHLETITSKVCRNAWSLVTVQPLGSEQLRPSIVMTQSAPFGHLEDEGESEMSQLEEEFAVHQLDTDPVPFLVKHRFLRPRGSSRSRLYACGCTGAESKLVKRKECLDGYAWQCSKCSQEWPLLRPKQTLFSWYAKVTLDKFLSVVKSWVLAHSCDEAAQLTGVDTFIVRSIWRSIQELCHLDVVRRVMPLGSGGEIVEVSAAHMDPFVVLAALDRKTNTFRAKVFPAATTSEVDIAKAACAWISREALITTRSTVMRFALMDEQASLRAPPVLTETPTLDNLLLIHLSDHFGNFRLETAAHKAILEGFLYEIEWRRAFGRFGPRECFWRMIAQLLPTSRDGVSFLMQVAPQFVTPGSPQMPLGVHLPSVDSSRRNIESDDEVTLVGEDEQQQETVVVLENYYYARREGERQVVKHKKYVSDGEMFFRCPVCKKVARNNIAIMKHIVMHLESNREFNPDINYLSICRYCYRDLETPFECQTHIQQVHLVSAEGDRLCCKICSLAFPDESQLVYHMKTTHTARDMPFLCKICHFRSSFKHHVIDHFRERHSGCNALQCPYCLDLYYCQARQVVTGIQGTTKFYSHLFKHLNNTPRTCGQCSLPFIKQKDLRAHREECHGSGVKGVGGKGKVTGCGWSSLKPVLVHEPRKKPTQPPLISTSNLNETIDSKLAKDMYNGSGDCGLPEVSLDEAPVSWLVPSLKLPEDVEDYDCRECHRPMTEDHFVRVLRCSECHFFTCCQSSFTGHMLRIHAQQKGRPVPKNIVSTPLLDNKLSTEKFIGRCKKCDEKFEDGNALLRHLVLECDGDEGASIELGKRKAATKQIQQSSVAVAVVAGSSSAKRRRPLDTLTTLSIATDEPSASSVSANSTRAISAAVSPKDCEIRDGDTKKFEDVGEPLTDVFNTSSSNAVGSTPVKTNVLKQAKGNKADVDPEMERFLFNLSLRSTAGCSGDFRVNLTGPKCVKEQWINMGLVQQEIESSSDSDDENEDPEKRQKREKAKRERAQGLLPKTKQAGVQASSSRSSRNKPADIDEISAADSPPSSSSSSSSDTSLTDDVDLD